MASHDDGLAVAAYAPSEVHTKIQGVDVVMEEDTEYPFRDRISLTVSPASPVRFPLYLRIPEWTSDPVVVEGGQGVPGLLPGTYHRIEREWRKGERVEITFPMPVRTVQGFNGSVSVERGPLVYSLRIGEAWSKLKQTGPVADWEVYPTSGWNYGLRVDLKTPSTSFQIHEELVTRQPFNSSSPPVMLEGKGRRLAEWVIVDDSAAPPPQSPVASRLEDETVKLIPYGAARLRITSFPVLGPAQPQNKVE